MNNQAALGAPISARFHGQIMAIDPHHGHGLMAAGVPVDVFAGHEIAANGSLAISVPRGEQFAVSRQVAVMPIRGVLTPNDESLARYLGWATYQGIERACEELAASDEVAAVVLDMNSAGGLIMGLQAASDAIAALSSVKPVHVLADPLVASAAYHIASQGTDIAMTRGGLVGSIGTMRNSIWPVEAGLDGDQWGVHISSHARAKMPNPTTDEGRAEIQRDLDAAEAEFLDRVAKGRGIDRASLPAVLSVTDSPEDGGAVFDPADAIARGLVDRVATRSEFYADIFGKYAPNSKPIRSRAKVQAALMGARVRRAKALSK